MHCPGCGQQQVSNETKFCSRCGLPLGIVSDVLAHGGSLPQLAELDRRNQTLFTRRNGLGFSLIWLLFFLFIMTPMWGILNVERLAGASAIIGIFGALILFVSSLLFLRKGLPNKFQSITSAVPAMDHLREPPLNAALPSHQSVPVSAYMTPQAGSWRDTNELDSKSYSKRCPACGMAYMDEAIVFCLADGSVLTTLSEEQATVFRNSAGKTTSPFASNRTDQSGGPSEGHTKLLHERKDR